MDVLSGVSLDVPDVNKLKRLRRLTEPEPTPEPELEAEPEPELGPESEPEPEPEPEPEMALTFKLLGDCSPLHSTGRVDVLSVASKSKSPEACSI